MTREGRTTGGQASKEIGRVRKLAVSCEEDEVETELQRTELRK